MSLYSVKNPYNNTKKSLPKRFLFIAGSKLQNMVSGKETPRCARKAAFTLEAAILMPLLACFFVSILFFFRVMQVQTEVQSALELTSRELAVCLEEESAGEVMLAKALFLKNMQGHKTALECVRGGGLAISLAKSVFAGDEICLRAEYRMELPVSVFWKKRLNVVQSAVTRKWVGWKGEKEETEDSWVYISETGTVYHRNRACTHLKLSIRCVSGIDINILRNENGEKYRRCYRCTEQNLTGGKVYITDEGECYHADLNCSGLKRMVRRVHLSEVAGWPCCSRCGGSGDAAVKASDVTGG